MKPPAFQFYADSWLSSLRVQLMSLEEEGAYIRCLSFCWRHGSIPADVELLSRLIGKGCSTNLASKVSSMFSPSSTPGELIHERLEFEREKQVAWRKKCSAGGKLSAKLKGKVTGKVTSKGSTALRSPSPSPSPSAVSSLHERKAAPPQPTDEVWLESLKLDPAYACLDVAREFAKSTRWCSENNRKITRRFFINWLNRIDKPMNGERKLEHGDAF